MNILNLCNLDINTNCDECEKCYALIHCLQCEQYMCESCDLKIHNKGKRAQHQRKNIVVDVINFYEDLEPHWLKQLNQYFNVPHEKYQCHDYKNLDNIQYAQRVVCVFNCNLEESVGDQYRLDDGSNVFKALKNKCQSLTCIFAQIYNNTLHFITKVIDEHGSMRGSGDITCSQLNKIIKELQSQQENPLDISEIVQKNLILNDISRNLESEQSSQDMSSRKDTKSQNSQQFILQITQQMEWETVQKKQSIHIFLSFIKQQAFKGIIVYTMDQLQQTLQDIKLPKQKMFELEYSGQEVITECIQREFILRTSRLFNDRQENFYSLNIKYITYESLCWVIVSIKRDFITPTERLILSRIKECFGIKLSKGEWSSIVQVISRRPLKARGELPLLCVRTTRDPLINEVMVGIYIIDQTWPVEDEIRPGIEKIPEWSMFLQFLDDYFGTDQCKNKVLTGGRYGCAQYIKQFGPKNLKECTLGRLTLFVQMAVNKGYIKYNRTILIASRVKQLNSDSFLEKQDSPGNNKQEQIKIAQKALLELLMDNPDGVQLAQLPQMLKQRVDYNDLGFPKLKNFLETMKDLVAVENYGKNNCVARLIGSPIKTKQKQQAGSDRTHYYKQPTQQTEIVSILLKVQYIVHTHCYGVSINTLYNELSNLMGEWFKFDRLGCSTFLQFLQNYADQMIVIVCQRYEYWIYERDYRFRPPPFSKDDLMSQSMHTQPVNENQFEQILSEAFPNQFQLPTWQDKPQQPQNSRIHNPQPEDSNLDIRENLRFIEELLGSGGQLYNTDNELTQRSDQWDSMNQQIGERGMMHSKTYSEDFDLNKALDERERRVTYHEKPMKR